MKFDIQKTNMALLLFAAAISISSTASAQSHVSIGGVIDTFTGVYRLSGNKPDPGMYSGGMTTSYMGFSGSEDLGGGTKAIFALNGYLRSNTGQGGRFDGDPLWARDSWVGLTGSFGTVTMGRNLAPNFLPMIRSNPFGDSFGFAPIVIHYHIPTTAAGNTIWQSSIGATDTGWSNQLSYTTPEFYGLKANVSYQLNSEDDSTRNWGGNVLYSNGPLELSAFYENSGVANPVSAALPNKLKSWMIGGSYDFKVVKLYGTYSQTKESNINRKDKTGSIGLGIPIGNSTIMASWGRTNRKELGLDMNRDTVSLGYDYNLSKRTDVYAVYMFDKVTYYSSGNTFVVGMRHRF